MILKKLKEPFKADDVEWRIQQSGENGGKPWAMVLCYITNRAIMDRLDDICGPENWKNEFKESPCGGVLCCISIKVGDRWISKWDGAENTQVEAVKGGLSSSMKRAAVQWGIGRYLYKLDASFVNCKLDKSGQNRGSIKPKSGRSYINFTWDAPRLPEWALPKIDVRKSVKAILSAIDEGQKSVIAENWRELTEDEQGEAWKAVTKGGYFTQDQKNTIKEALNESY